MNSLHDDDDGSDDGHVGRREEAVRRAQLYGVSSKRKLPCVHLQPRDARTRRELQLLAEPQQLVVRDGLSVYEDELELRKHHEHLSLRPALDQSQPLNDLYTTVPRLVVQLQEEDKLGTTAKHPREWVVGYKNAPQSDYHGVALRGVFEPTDTTRERLMQTTDRYRQSSTALAYPTPLTDVAMVPKLLVPHDTEKARKELEAKLHVGMESSSAKKKHWSPASHATLGTKTPKPKSKAAKMVLQVDQQFPVRKVESPLKKAELQADPRHIRNQQKLTNQVNEALAEIQRQAAQSKDPTVRYSLPVENPTFERAYRLGLDPVDSSPATFCESSHHLSSSNNKIDTSSPRIQTKKPSKTTKPPLLFRPKSAVSLRMDTAMSPQLSRSSSSTSLLCGTATIAKVAGAKRRPHSATISYLSNSTVYFMNGTAMASSVTRPGRDPLDPPSSMSSEQSISAALVGNAHEVLQEQKKYGANFLGVVLDERVRRHELQRERLFDLARRGLLHSIPMPQIFARLRREALKNLKKRIEYARYEKLSVDDYMSICGMAVVPATSPPRHDELRELEPVDDDVGDEDDDEFPREDQNTAKTCLASEDVVVQALRDEAELRQLPFDEPANSVFRKRQAIRPEPVNGNNSSTIQAMRRALYVTREQFHIAMEAFALPTRDVNLLYSSLDLNVDDNVPLWEIVCAVEQLQDGHEEIRRSRVQVKARHLPKELSVLRRSVSFPHSTHVALPLG